MCRQLKKTGAAADININQDTPDMQTELHNHD